MYVIYLTKQLVLFNYRLIFIWPDVFKNSSLKRWNATGVFDNSHLGVKHVSRYAQNPENQWERRYSRTPFWQKRKTLGYFPISKITYSKTPL
jgi:hypothetical protein